MLKFSQGESLVEVWSLPVFMVSVGMLEEPALLLCSAFVAWFWRLARKICLSVQVTVVWFFCVGKVTVPGFVWCPCVGWPHPNGPEMCRDDFFGKRVMSSCSPQAVSHCMIRTLLEVN